MPCALRCVACAVYWPGASAAVAIDHELPARGAVTVWTGAPVAVGPW